MTFGQSVNTCLKQKYATFEGRAPRSEFWWFALFSFLVQIGAQVVTGILAAIEPTLGLIGMIAMLVIVLGLIIPSIAVGVRRLHDLDRSGWWYLIALVPLIGAIVLLVFFVSRGTQGDNQYGPDPLSGAGSGAAHPAE